jgi:hypothetical protein
MTPTTATPPATEQATDKATIRPFQPVSVPEAELADTIV